VPYFYCAYSVLVFRSPNEKIPPLWSEAAVSCLYSNRRTAVLELKRQSAQSRNAQRAAPEAKRALKNNIMNLYCCFLCVVNGAIAQQTAKI
jgi:hypothetical protein